MLSVRERLRLTFGRVGHPDTFAAGGELEEFPYTGLKVDGIGTIATPLVAVQAKALIEKAEVTTSGLTFQIDASKLVLGQSWTDAMNRLAGESCTLLGVAPGLSIQAKLQKLLLYETGGFSKAHTLIKETENEQRTFATMIVQLPVDGGHAGGTLKVSYAGDSKNFEFAGDEYKTFYAIFFADCEHEVQKITSGKRLFLTYNLAINGPGPLPRAANYSRDIEIIREAIQTWEGLEAPSLKKLAIALEHEYTADSLSFATLKDRDIAVVNAIREVGLLEMHLALVVKHVSGAYNGSNGPFSYPSMGKIYKTSIRSKQWLAEGDKQPVFTSMSLHLGKEMLDGKVGVDRFQNKEPNEHHYRGYIPANAGHTLDYLYYQAVIVIWPKSKTLELMFAFDFGAAVKIIARQIGEGTIQEARMSLDATLAFAKTNVGKVFRSLESLLAPSLKLENASAVLFVFTSIANGLRHYPDVPISDVCVRSVHRALDSKLLEWKGDLKKATLTLVSHTAKIQCEWGKKKIPKCEWGIIAKLVNGLFKHREAGDDIVRLMFRVVFSLDDRALMEVFSVDLLRVLIRDGFEVELTTLLARADSIFPLHKQFGKFAGVLCKCVGVGHKPLAKVLKGLATKYLHHSVRTLHVSQRSQKELLNVFFAALGTKFTMTAEMPTITETEFFLVSCERLARKFRSKHGDAVARLSTQALLSLEDSELYFVLTSHPIISTCLSRLLFMPHCGDANENEREQFLQRAPMLKPETLFKMLSTLLTSSHSGDIDDAQRSRYIPGLKRSMVIYRGKTDQVNSRLKLVSFNISKGGVVAAFWKVAGKSTYRIAAQGAVVNNDLTIVCSCLASPKSHFKQGRISTCQHGAAALLSVVDPRYASRKKKTYAGASKAYKSGMNWRRIRGLVAVYISAFINKVDASGYDGFLSITCYMIRDEASDSLDDLARMLLLNTGSGLVDSRCGQIIRQVLALDEATVAIKTLAPVRRLAEAWAQALSSFLPAPASSWCQPNANIIGYPEVTKFLRGPAAKMTFHRLAGGSITAVRYFCSRFFSDGGVGHGASAKITYGGMDNNAYVTITKTKTGFARNPQAYLPLKIELGRIRALLLGQLSVGDAVAKRPRRSASAGPLGHPHPPRMSAESLGHPPPPRMSAESLGPSHPPRMSAQSSGHPPSPRMSAESLGHPHPLCMSAESSGLPPSPRMSAESLGHPHPLRMSAESSGHPPPPRMSASAESLGHPPSPRMSAESLGPPPSPRMSAGSLGPPSPTIDLSTNQNETIMLI